MISKEYRWTIEQWEDEVVKQLNNPDWTAETILEDDGETIKYLLVKTSDGNYIKPPSK